MAFKIDFKDEIRAICPYFYLWKIDVYSYFSMKILSNEHQGIFCHNRSLMKLCNILLSSHLIIWNKISYHGWNGALIIIQAYPRSP